MRKIFLPLLTLIFFGCNRDDEITIPTFLDFREVATYASNQIGHSTGFLGSEQLNSVFIAHRENREGELGELITRINLGSGVRKERFFEQPDFVTKRLHIINNRLYVIGGRFVTEYPIALDEDPEFGPHGLQITRFGSVVYQDEIYVWGGDINEFNSNWIYKLSNKTFRFDQIGEFPAPKTWANGSAVGDRIFIFGGQSEFLNTPPNDVIYIYDISDTTVATLNLPMDMDRTYTAERKGVIYVAGAVLVGDPQDFNFDIVFGAFDTRSFAFGEIPISLQDAGTTGIHGMTIMDDRLFVIYGDAQEEDPEFSIMEARLP